MIFSMHISLYIHFPFCVKKCLYCDFDSVSGSSVTTDEYVTAVVREMELRRAGLDRPVSVPTLYFGGGTPSLMAPELVGRVIDAAARLYGVEADAEVTLEANPGTLTTEKLAGYRQAGVNRLSLGVQSLDDGLLQRLGRVHSAEEARAAFETARDAGFANIGIDLIHSLPGQTLAMWQSTLATAMALAPEHISAYGLSVEEGTPFAAMEERGELPLPDENEAVAMFEATREILVTGGYEHYEISNFARPGCRSRHNQVYWRRGNYLGFGAGAHSFLQKPTWGLRWVNPRNHSDYLSSIGEGLPRQDELQQLSLREGMAEQFFLGLRLLDGVDLEQARTDFGPALDEAYGGIITDLIARGLLVREGARLRIAPGSIILANRIFSAFV